jgi:hypothetical protein
LLLTKQRKHLVWITFIWALWMYVLQNRWCMWRTLGKNVLCYLFTDFLKPILITAMNMYHRVKFWTWYIIWGRFMGFVINFRLAQFCYSCFFFSKLRWGIHFWFFTLTVISVNKTFTSHSYTYDTLTCYRIVAKAVVSLVDSAVCCWNVSTCGNIGNMFIALYYQFLCLLEICILPNLIIKYILT